MKNEFVSVETTPSSIVNARTVFNQGFTVSISYSAYLNLDVDSKVDVNEFRDPEASRSGSASGTVWDGIVGIKGEVTLNEKWYLPYYLDIGTGETDLTYQAFGGVGYQFSRVDLVAGWRYLRWNFDDSSAFDNMYINGPLVGVKIRF